MSRSTDNRREFSRVPVALEGRVCRAEGHCFHGQLLDLSVGGVLFAGQHDFAEGTEVVVEVLAGDGHSLPLVCADGLVARTTERGTAIAFAGMDVESGDALRALVLAHTDDPERVIEEFRDHPALRRREGQ